MGKTWKSHSKYYLNQEQAKQFIESTINSKERLIITLLLYNGLRRVETTRINVEDIDFDNKTIIVHRKKTVLRPHGEQVAPLLPITEKTLLNYLHENKIYSGKIFDKTLTAKKVWEIVIRVSKRSGIKSPDPYRKQITPHTLRHTCARILKENQIDIDIIAELLGHESSKSTLYLYGTAGHKEVYKKLKDFKW